MLRVVLLAYLFSFHYYYCYYYYYFKTGSPTGVLGYGICLIKSKVIRDFKAKLVRDSGLKDYRGYGMSPKINIGITESRVRVGMTGLERNPIEDPASVNAARCYGPLSSSLEE